MMRRAGTPARSSRSGRQFVAVIPGRAKVGSAGATADPASIKAGRGGCVRARFQSFDDELALSRCQAIDAAQSLRALASDTAEVQQTQSRASAKSTYRLVAVRSWAGMMIVVGNCRRCHASLQAGTDKRIPRDPRRNRAIERTAAGYDGPLIALSVTYGPFMFQKVQRVVHRCENAV